MPTRNINLTDYLNDFVESQVKSGRYGNASEVVREGLRLVEQQNRRNEAKLKWLRAAVQEGIDELARGEGIEFASVDDFERHLDQMATQRRAAPKRSRGRGK